MTLLDSPSPVAEGAVRACPVCRGTTARRFLSFPPVPVFCNILWESREAAVSAPRGSIALAVCGRCGHVYNDCFDPGQVAYSPRYENSLHHSGVFREYASSLVHRLVEEHGLRGKRVLEIGCGQGDFLSELCVAGESTGVGFDPSFAGGPPPPGVERIESVHFTPEFANERPDAIVCRQVLEHIQDPRAFVSMLREAIGDRDVFVFFEVPNGLWCFGGGGTWDVIYEHCGYFTPESLERVFREAGFGAVSVADSFGGQFLTLTARANSHTGDAPAADFVQVADVTEAGAEMARDIAFWRSELPRLDRECGRVVIWGAGSKGVTFLNLADTDQLVECVVDINPRKQGMYVPGTGQLVVGPEALVASPPGVVIVMNPNYVPEIAARLGGLLIETHLVSASGVVAVS